MEKIIIRGLEFSACHGVKEFEKTTPQPFIFDADIYFDAFPAYQSDDILQTINYSAASSVIGSVVQGNTFNLIEKLAYECAYAVMSALPVQKIALTVYKPKAPMKQKFSTVGFSVEVERNTAYLSLGSNLGDRRAYLVTALQKLNTFPQIEVKKVSSFIETEPYGGVATHRFLNCAAAVETLFSPQQLLGAIHSVEEECGRVRKEHWGDRTLDIDIIFFGKQTVCSDGLIIPHPEYARRDFVLRPLAEIAPDFVCPVSNKKIKDLLL